MSRLTPNHYSTTRLVREFHTAFGHPVRTDGPSLDIGDDVIHLRMALIAEEFAELVDAVYGPASGDAVREGFEFAVGADDGERDLISAADALGDLDYVIAGFSIAAGIPHEDVVAEIHASNLSKMGADGKPVVREDGKILKGEHYFAPNIAAVLGIPT
jgi:predicted HAD superfamily Cof-like phosphohydrolase